MTEDPIESAGRTGERPAAPDTALAEFFDPDFMAEHTQFESFEAFWAESPWTVDEAVEIDRLPREELDQYVARTTQFDHWVAMRNEAAEREIRREHLL